MHFFSQAEGASVVEWKMRDATAKAGCSVLSRRSCLFGGDGKIGTEMAQTYDDGSIQLELLPDDTWRLVEARDDAQVPSVVEGKVVSVIGTHAFDYRSTLRHIEVPEGVKYLESESFMSRHIKSIRLSSTVCEIHPFAFSFSPWIERVDASEDNVWFTSEDGILYTKDKTIVRRYPPSRPGETFSIPKTVRHIWSRSFSEAWKLLELEIPGNVETIGLRSFSESEFLASLRICEGVRTIDEDAFDGCYKLKTLWLPDSLESLNGPSPFGDLMFVEDLRMPSWVEELPEWFSIFEPSSLKVLDCESMGIGDVPKQYRDALLRGAVRRYCAGERMDKYMEYDYLTYAGDRCEDLLSECIDNEELRRYLMEHGVMSTRHANQVAAEASKRGLLELTAQLIEYSREKDGYRPSSSSLEL